MSAQRWERSRTTEAWYACLDILLTSVLKTVELTYPKLVEQGRGGSIVITSSMAALKPMMRTEARHTLGLLGYSAAKAALINLARNYASFLAHHHIRVNTVHPSAVNTPMINNDMCVGGFEASDEQDLLALVNAFPVTRIEPEEVANTVLWLCSSESQYFTGNVVRIDAGSSLR